MRQCLWTMDGGRLQYQSARNDNGINWLFLPGGPGLGSEAVAGLTGMLKDRIPGVIWHFDLPNDGSNILKDKPISNWRSSLVQAITAFDKVILVAHSTPGMYVQTMPELEEMLYGLVLIGSAPDGSWQPMFEEHCKNNADSIIHEAEKIYNENQDNESLRKLLVAAARYCFTNEQALIDGKELFKQIPVNHAASKWSSENFDSENYKATWIPQKIPTLITTGSNDCITSLDLFKNNPEYVRNNILIEEIGNAGHYPWFENPSEIVRVFEKFCEVYDL